MKNLFTLLIVNIFFVNANAQTPQLSWTKSFNGKSLSTDSSSIMKMYILDKSIYVAGTSDAYGTANDIVLIKRDYVTGDTLWTRHYNGPANSDDQAVDMEINQTTGDVYITGKSMGIGTGYDVVTLKYSSSGALGWANRWDNTSYHGDEIPKDIGIDGSGRIIVSATTFNGNSGAFSPDYEDLLILVYNSTGSLTNSPKINIATSGSFSNQKSIDLIGGARVSSNGGIFVAGEIMWGTSSNGISFVFLFGLKSTANNLVVDYYSGSCTGSGIFDVEATGFPMAASTPDDINFFNALDIDNANNVYLAYLFDTIYGAGTSYTMGIAKINNLGCTVWQNKTGKNANYKNLRVNAIKADATGNVYAAGYEKNGSGNFDWFIIKYNISGVLQWRINKDGSGNGHDIAYDIAFDEFQNPIIAGSTKNTSGNDDITFIKYNKTNGSEIFSVNYDSGNEDDRAYNIIVDASQKIVINGIQSTPSQSLNMISLLYCNPVGAAGTITGISTVCQGQNSVTYTIPEIENAISYIWTLPGGATGTSITNSITVNFGTSAISGDITVKGQNDCNDGAISSLEITVNPLPENAGIIGGTTKVCQGQNSLTYTVPVIANSSSYVWTLPSEATGTSTSNSITVNYGLSAISGNITVKGDNSCGNGVMSSLEIILNPLPANAEIISGTSNVCLDQNVLVYTVPVIANATSYIWTLPGGATGTSTSNSITVNYGISSITGNITVKGNNSCGDGATSTIAIIVNDKPATPVITLNGNSIHSDAVTGNQWYNQAGLINGATNQNYNPISNGTYYVIVTLEGCSSSPSNTINYAVTGIEQFELNNVINIYPNPVTNELTIEIKGNTKSTNFEILNSIGQVVYKGFLLEKTIVPTENFFPGIYLIKFENDKKFEFMKIVKE